MHKWQKALQTDLKGNDREGPQFDFMHFNYKVEYDININFFVITAFSLNISFIAD